MRGEGRGQMRGEVRKGVGRERDWSGVKVKGVEGVEACVMNV